MFNTLHRAFKVYISKAITVNTAQISHNVFKDVHSFMCVIFRHFPYFLMLRAEWKAAHLHRQEKKLHE